LNSSGCTACHAVDKPLVGPPFKSVAERYRGDAGAAARLAAKVRQGGAGVWGQTPMPPNAALSEADLKRIVDWVLAQK
jgi:cytochrome c